MIVGIDPFSCSDPMGIYQKVLKNKIRFPRTFNKDARDLVKRLVVANLSKRYGNLINGVEDIKKHKWLREMEWTNLLNKKTSP